LRRWSSSSRFGLTSDPGDGVISERSWSHACWNRNDNKHLPTLSVTTIPNVDLNAPGVEETVLADPRIQAELVRQSRDLVELADASARAERSVVARFWQRAQSEGSAALSPWPTDVALEIMLGRHHPRCPDDDLWGRSGRESKLD
jgi:hypothetical protein